MELSFTELWSWKLIDLQYTLGDYFVHLLTPCHQGPWDMELISQIKFNHAFDLKFKINIKFL